MTPSAVVEQLRESFERNGYVRRQNADRLADEGWQGYHKGDEVRLTAGSEAELRGITRLLRRAGFEPGRPFVKGKQYRVPIYGRQEVSRFLDLISRGA